MMRHSLASLNQCSRAEFAQVVGGVYENSPWIARQAHEQLPFSSVADLEAKLQAVVRAADDAAKLALIRAHPDLVGRLALQGRLSAESQAEQSGAGLGALTPEEIATFNELNARYRERFQFPFVICARLNDKTSILNAFHARLSSTPDVEMTTALAEIEKIARLRLAQLVTVEP